MIDCIPSGVIVYIWKITCRSYLNKLYSKNDSGVIMKRRDLTFSTYSLKVLGALEQINGNLVNYLVNQR